MYVAFYSGMTTAWEETCRAVKAVGRVACLAWNLGDNVLSGMFYWPIECATDV